MNRIILGNCLDTLVRLRDKSIDLLCTDPPYGIWFIIYHRQSQTSRTLYDFNP